MLAGPRDPVGQACAGGHRARGIVRRTEVRDVRVGAGRRVREEAVGLGRREVEDARVAALVVGRPRAARHHVGVDVDGVDRVGHRDPRVRGEDLLDVSAVLLAAVGDEDLVGGDLDAARAVVVLADRVDQEVVAVLRPVAAEALRARHLVGGPVERGDDRRGQGLGDVADAQADQLRVGVGVGEGRHAAPDLGEEIARRELQIVLVDVRHRANVAAPRQRTGWR